MTSSILYQPIDSEVYQLIKKTGADYYGTLIAPYVRSGARRVVGRYSPEEIYSTKRGQIEREIREEVVAKMDGRHLRINAILIREVHLPAVVQAAIQTKLQEEQKALEMRFILDRTRQKADHKRVEAAGFADFQATISKGLPWRAARSPRRRAQAPKTRLARRQP